jgi:hypothetical protein
MSLSNTNALVSIQEGAGAVNNVATGAMQLVTSGAKLTFALQSTSGVARWTLSFKAQNFPALDNLTIDWFQGMANALTVQLPQDQVTTQSVQQGIEFISTVSDGSAGIGSVIGFLTTRSNAAIPFQHQVRGVILTALNAYTIASGVITSNTNGAMVNVDTNIVPAVGDLYLLPNGIAGSAADAGIYQVTNLGTANTKFVLTSAPEWGQGAAVPPKTEILVSEGTLMSNTTWVVTNTGQANLIGTNSITFYPRVVSQQVALVSGTINVNNVPVLSNAKSQVLVTRNNAIGTVTSTVQYGVNVPITAGALGTAVVTIMALNAGATVVAADSSTVVVSIFNQV